MLRFTIFLLLFPTLVSFSQNDEGFIFGKITTDDNNEYIGQIRWNDEEAFWFDHFNSTKLGNEFVEYLPKEARERTEKGSITINNWKIITTSHQYTSNHNHLFVCRFGDIAKIEPHFDDEVTLTFKNGYVYELEGGSNDIETDIYILDQEMGKVKLKWDRIKMIEFMATPKNLQKKLGHALYGTVHTERNGAFEGYVQWDHDERLSGDKLDGENRNGEYEIAFGDILSIKKINDESSKVVLKSGRSLTLEGTNDVDDGNRGIIVNIPGMGRVDIDWDEFDYVEFDTDYKKSGPGYDSYETPQRLAGTVKEETDQISAGMIIYDLDEIWDFEILQGDMDEIEYLIPFRNIKSIMPIFDDASRIKLRNGEKIELEDSQDVSERNTGMIVMQDDKGKDAIYIPFDEIDEIEFK